MSRSIEKVLYLNTDLRNAFHPYIEKAVSNSDTLDAESVITGINTGQYQIFALLNKSNVIGVIITQVIKYPKKSALFILAIGSDEHTMDDWFDHAWEELNAYAKHRHCKYIQATGRNGWLKRVPGAKSLNAWESKV